jgi:hypothetical protein
VRLLSCGVTIALRRIPGGACCKARSHRLGAPIAIGALISDEAHAERRMREALWKYLAIRNWVLLDPSAMRVTRDLDVSLDPGNESLIVVLPIRRWLL